MTTLNGVRAELAEALSADRVQSTSLGRGAYERDVRPRAPSRPGLVVLPVNSQEVQAVLRICHRHRIPVVPRGSGTGLMGGAEPHPQGVLLVTTKMRAILEINPLDGNALVEPGVLGATLARAVEPYGLRYAPDSPRSEVSTLGGSVAQNAGGARETAYGDTGRHVIELEVVLSDGSIETFGDGTGEGWGYDFRGLMVGSEGTLGVITRIRLRLERRSDEATMLVGHFPLAARAAAAVTRLLELGLEPSAAEILDARVCQGCEAFLPLGLFPAEGAALVLEWEAFSDGGKACARQADEVIRKSGAVEVVARDALADRLRVWRARNAAFVALSRAGSDVSVQEGVVLRSQLGGFLQHLEVARAAAGLEVAMTYRALSGNLSLGILHGARGPEPGQRVSALATEVSDLFQAHGYGPLGESGVGVEGAGMMPRLFSEADIELMERIREALDPRRILNPKKLTVAAGEVPIPGPYRPSPLEEAVNREFW